ncbi:MAG: tetratricopeptide repeat protein [Burkholderiales bacterium]|nr:tetratricopeptide repeat protein [Burkholderiales bacterium]
MRPPITADARRRVLGALVAAFLAVPLTVRGGEAEWRMLYEQSDLHFQRGNLAQAELFAREALKEADASLGGSSRAAELSLARAVFMLRLAGKLDEALGLAVRGVRVSTKLHGPGDPQTAIALQNQAEVLFAQKKYGAAEQLHRRALAIFQTRPGEKSFQAATSLHNVGTMLLAQDKFLEAERFLRRALAVKERVLKPGHRSIAHTLNNLVLALEAQGKSAEAANYRARAAASGGT